MWVWIDKLGNANLKSSFVKKVENLNYNYKRGCYIEMGKDLPFEYQLYIKSFGFALEVKDNMFYAIKYDREQIGIYFLTGRIKEPGTKVALKIDQTRYGYIDTVYNGYYIVYTADGAIELDWDDVI